MPEAEAIGYTSRFTRTELQQWRRRIESATSDSERARLLKQLDNRLKSLASASTYRVV